MRPDEFDPAVQEERAAAAGGDRRLFFRLVYNERPVPEPGAEAAPMIARNTLVCGVGAA